MLPEIAYYDGVWGSPKELKIPLEDRGYLFGEGVYEVVLAYNHIPFALEDHLDRLESSLMKMEMQMLMARAALKAVIEQGTGQVKGDVLMAYFQITRGGSTPRSHHYLNVIDESKLMMTVRPYDDNHGYMQGVSAVTFPDMRWGHCDIKTVNLIPNAMAATAAARVGAYTAIMHRDGMVTEAAAASAFIAKDGIVYVTPLSDGILPSITRRHIVDHAAEWGVDLREEYFSLEQLFAADEVFLAGSTRHPCPIIAIDGKQIGSGVTGPISWNIHNHYEEMIASVCGPRP